MSVSPSRPPLPPLNALRAFEAAARLGRFTRAAEELGVTPGAISQHIQKLEAWAGTPLFDRRSHGVTLSIAGAQILPQLTAAFDTLGQAVRQMRGQAPARQVQIAALPAVAQLWLQPRLPALRAALPAGTALSVIALEEPPNLMREMFDLTFFLRPPDEAPGATVLAAETLLPVCAPALADDITAPEDLNRQVLLHDHAWAGDWALWAEATGCALNAPAAGPQFSLYALALEEAAAGAGVLMGHLPLIALALATGRLVAPFPDPVPRGRALMAEAAPGSSVATAILRALAPI